MKMYEHFDAGLAAWKAERFDAVNPHSINTQASERWYAGWCSGKNEDLYGVKS